MFNSTLLDHFENPRNVGEMPSPALNVRVENPICGDILALSARAAEGRIEEVRYQARGCTASIAVGSALTEMLIGKTWAEAAKLGPREIESAVEGLPNESKHAAVLAADAVKALVKLAG